MFVKRGSNCRARDTEQNGGQLDKFLTSGRPVRSDRRRKGTFFKTEKRLILGKKTEESGEQRESTSTKLAVIFEDYHSTRPKEQ